MTTLFETLFMSNADSVQTDTVPWTCQTCRKVEIDAS